MTDSAPAFEPTGLGLTIFQERYARNSEETWDEACMRLATAISAAENNGDVDRFRARYHDQLVRGLFMPGGRFWYGAGRRFQSMNNCYVLDVEDSIEGWGKLMHDVSVISSKGGGVGINFSPVRPRGYPIGGMGGTATGAVSLMRIIDGIGKEIKDGGGRRAALMMCLDIDHPDILEFLDAKLKVGDIENANISVCLPHGFSAEEFARLVREDGEYPLRWGGLPDREGRAVKARGIWERLVENAWRNGEPGVLNMDLANRENTLSFEKAVIATNPCGEIVMGANGLCCLGSLVLPRFVVDGKMDWDQLDESIRLAVRFLDASLDVSDYPLPAIKETAQAERRIGLGVMGLHSMLLDLGMRYSSDEALAFVDKLFGFIKNTAYDTSISLAIEKGPFPLFRQEFLKTGFVKRLKRGLRNKVKEHGIRNSNLLTVPPTGTTSMVHGCTGGLEPTFSPVYERRRRIVDAKQRESIATTLVVSQEYTDHPELVEGAYDVSPRAHMRMQATVQPHLDQASSKTINLPRAMPVEELSDLWLEFLPHLKGTTFYREGSRETADSFEPMKYVPADEMADTIAEWTAAGKDIEYEDGSLVDDCAGGSCEVSFGEPS